MELEFERTLHSDKFPLFGITISTVMVEYIKKVVSKQYTSAPKSHTHVRARARNHTHLL
jgi:hypothetical protein